MRARGGPHPLPPSPVVTGEGEHSRTGLAEDRTTCTHLSVEPGREPGLPSPAPAGEGLGVRARPLLLLRARLAADHRVGDALAAGAGQGLEERLEAVLCLARGDIEDA